MTLLPTYFPLTPLGLLAYGWELRKKVGKKVYRRRLTLISLSLSYSYI